MLTKIPNCVQYYVVLTFQVKRNFVQIGRASCRERVYLEV